MKRVLLLFLLPLLWSCATNGPTPAERLLLLYSPERPFAESRFSTFGGITLHYRTWVPQGETQGKLLLLHAAGGSTVSYRRLGPALAEAGYAVVAVDLPAFGFSDRALDFEHSLPNRAGLLWSLLDRLDTEENAFPPADTWILGGHAMGGRVAAQMAIERPARARGLLLFAADLTNGGRPGRFHWLPPVRWAVRSWLENSIYTMEGVEELLGEAYGRAPFEEEVDLYAAPLLRPGMPKAYIRYARTAGEIEFSLASLSLRTLIVWGSEDRRADPEIAEVMAEQLPDAESTLIREAGHLPMETHTAATRDAIVAWLRQSLYAPGQQ